MTNKSCSNRARPLRGSKIAGPAPAWNRRFALLVFALVLAPAARSSDAPGWMHALTNAPLPSHDDKTEAILMYSEEVLNVQSNGKMKGTARRVYKILRPDGRKYGKLHFYFDGETKITALRAWCIPPQGKDYEVKDKDVIETGYNGVEGGDLFSDLRVKSIDVPAADPGSLVGYEMEHEDRPFIFQDEWFFQESIPVREAHYSLQLPPGWEYKAVWLNHEEVLPTRAGTNHFQWVVTDIPELRKERQMPPDPAVAGQMILHIFAPKGDSTKSFATWNDMGKWYGELWKGRQNTSTEIKQKVAELTKPHPAKLDQIRALASFVQDDVRYVAIEMGIGGWQPHPPEDVFVHKYGDCKDKSVLLSVMLREIGVDSYDLLIFTRRGVVAPNVPPRLGIFNHAILAIRLPDDVKDPSLLSVFQHPQLGRLLYFDPTDDGTPLGEIRGELQANYALLVSPTGGELIQLPQLFPTQNAIYRLAHLTLDERGILQGDVQEFRKGDSAADQRYALKSVVTESDKIKPIETLMAASLSTFHITKASVTGLQQRELPLRFDWTFYSEDYAKSAGHLLLLRPRVLGVKADNVLETKEPRKFPVEFNAPHHDRDTFEITIPTGYEVDELPEAADVDYSFGSYHSKTEKQGNVLRYTRTFEIKELSVPVDKAEDLKRFYRIIASDERNTAVLKPTAH